MIETRRFKIVVIEFQSSWIVVYYKIHFRVLLQRICAGKVSVVIVIDREYNLVCSLKVNTMVETRKTQLSNYNYFLLLKCNFSR